MVCTKLASDNTKTQIGYYNAMEDIGWDGGGVTKCKDEAKHVKRVLVYAAQRDSQ